MKPIIGVNVDIEDGPRQKAWIFTNYFESVQKAGGIPILLPPMPDEDLKQCLQQINGLLLIGGPDYDPKHYQESQHEKAHLVPSLRDDFDMRLIQRAIVGTNMPVLGICAGMQLLNIGMGGSLHQDIPSTFPSTEVEHSATQGWSSKHKVRIEPNSKLSQIYGAREVDVVTSHHQSVNRLGAALKPTAYAEDDIIEAIEHPDKPFVVAVQWHPERDYETNKNLFEEFIKQASRVTVTAQ